MGNLIIIILMCIVIAIGITSILLILSLIQLIKEQGKEKFERIETTPNTEKEKECNKEEYSYKNKEYSADELSLLSDRALKEIRMSKIREYSNLDGRRDDLINAITKYQRIITDKKNKFNRAENA